METLEVMITVLIICFPLYNYVHASKDHIIYFDLYYTNLCHLYLYYIIAFLIKDRQFLLYLL
jgi:hypothetical protein